MTQVEYIKHRSIEWRGNNRDEIVELLENTYPITEESSGELHIHLPEGGVDVLVIGDSVTRKL